MGATVSVRNQTPYTWYYEVIGNGGRSGTLQAWQSAEINLSKRWVHNDLNVRYYTHSWNSFSYEFNSHKGDGNQTFTIIETSDRSCIQLQCSTEDNSPICPNYGKQEEDRIRQQQEEMERRRQEEQRRQEQEERRRQEQLERERRIQQEIERESELSAKKMSKGQEKLRQKLSLRAQQLNHQRTQVLHQMIEDDAAAVSRDEESLQTAEKIEGYFPRLTQLASLLMLLLPQLTGEKGILLEIGTGEGKSCILAMFATIQAIRGINIDIVTSSPVLARRDQEEWQKLYDMFGVTSSVVPPPQIQGSSSESRDSRLQEAYKKQLVYGTVGSFAADALRQEFEKDTTRGERKFDMVIVDEVDYMTLDNGVQVTFLSHEASGLRHLDQVLASIWSMVSMCQPIGMEESGEIEWATGIQHFHKAAKLAVIGPETSDNFSEFDILDTGVELGLYSVEDLNMLMQALETTDKDNTMENRLIIDTFMAKVGVNQQCDLLTILENALENTVAIDRYTLNNNKAVLVEKKTLDHNPDILDIKMLLLENGRASEIIAEDKLIKATVSELMSKIKYSHNSELKSDFLIIPSFLEKFLENRLPVFVQNALKAIMMTQGREYMIDQASENVIKTHLYHAIIPVDFQASGVLEKNKRWGDGLQQFLEMKHQLAITPLSNVTNYLSNVHYFKRYLKGNGLFGVSGTLGGDADKVFLARHYKTNSYTIPAHRHKKVVELPAIQISGKDQWMEILCKTAWRVADGGQVVLVVCEDVKTANELQNKMKSDNPQTPITLYTISEKHNIESTKFIGGHIIIATNLGGRGTDIKVDKDVNLCGGLFVLLTHYPGSRRVEKQVFGRTGRKGNPGMVQMIVCEDTLAPAYQGQPVEIMRQIREEYEVKRIKDMETDELLEINIKEELFETFCKFLEQFDSKFTKEEKEDLSGMKQNNVPQCFKDRSTKFDYHPALNALKETWALWLTLHEEHINRHEDISVLKEDLLKHITNRSNMLLDGKSHTFFDHIKQAIGRTDLHCRNKNNCDYGAKSYWKDVEDCDPFYSAVALYNQAFITINMAKGDYKTEACVLLEKAIKKIDVYLLETTNTMVSFQMATRASVLDIYVLTNSDLLQGKGIRLTVVDQQGKTLSEETYPGTNSFAGQITLRLTKEKTDSEKGTISKVKDRIKGVQNSYSGHFDIIQDGAVIPVHSENQNCLYTAVAQATMSDKTNDEINKEAVNLRNNVKDQIKNNLPVHSEMIQTQTFYDKLKNNYGKYTIVGGTKTEPENNVEYEKDISPMKKVSYGSTGLTEYKIAKNYHLALVGPYKRMKTTNMFSNETQNRGIVVADHILPKDSLKLARDHPQMEDLRQRNPKLYDLIDSIGSDPNGMNLVAMRVLKQHHRDALTTGTSKESDNCRKLLADTLVNGDAEKSLKLSFIMAHPVASNQLRHNAGHPLSLGSNASFMSTKGTVSYYKAGFNQMLNHHNENGLIDQNQLESLKSWVADDKYLDLKTPESTDVLKAIERKNLP
ncbi:hypothetical protein DPEC_G00334400 [Dallia pectoralis]|uniref:Uncharacterized protein n=1 Tax=Dallia pectoralis TaxID=75939 RepID=A0ACC2F6S5_DALPE|nr:hypothetical protein DPEC_G00334400 [Dallia pectoralis]